MRLEGGDEDGSGWRACDKDGARWEEDVQWKVDMLQTRASLTSFIPIIMPCESALIRLRRINNFLLFHAIIIQLSHTFGNILYDLLD